MKPAALLILLFLSCPACLMADNAALAARAREQVGVTVSYNGGYQSIPYPNGDVPLETGVCTDVVIRAMRAFGLDLQKAVHGLLCSLIFNIQGASRKKKDTGICVFGFCFFIPALWERDFFL